MRRVGRLASPTYRRDREPAAWAEWFRPSEPWEPVVCDRTGRAYFIQECCRVWDRDRGFHSPGCRR